jgi:hypothetical protein
MFKTKPVTIGDIKKMNPDKRVDISAGEIQMLVGMIEKAQETASRQKDYIAVSELGNRNAKGNDKYITPTELISSGITGDVLVEAKELKMFFKEVWALEDSIGSLRETVKSLDQEVRLTRTNAKVTLALASIDKAERIIIKGGIFDEKH